MREIRTSGSEGGGAETNRLFLPLSGVFLTNEPPTHNVALILTCRLTTSNNQRNGENTMRKHNRSFSGSTDEPSRRQFLTQSAMAGIAAIAAPAIVSGRNLNDKLNLAIIGAGGRGASNLRDVESEISLANPPITPATPVATSASAMTSMSSESVRC